MASTSASATVPDMYGMGARNIGMAGASVAIADDAWGSFYNPAGIGQVRRFSLEAAFVGGQARLLDFQDVVYDTDADGSLLDEDGYPNAGPVGTDYRARPDGTRVPLQTAGMQMGLVFPVGQSFTIGMAMHLPSESLLRIQLQDPTMPYYVMYRARNDRFMLGPAISVRPFRGVWIGAGAQLMAKAVMNVRATATVDVSAFSSDTAEGDPEVSGNIVMQIDEAHISTKNRLAPNLGLLVNLGAFVPYGTKAYDLLQNFSFGLVYRGTWGVPTSADVTAVANGRVRFDDQEVLVSQLTDGPIEMEIADVLAFYNPPQIAFGARGGPGWLIASFDLTWAKWSGFQELMTPYNTMSINSLAGTSITVQTGSELPPPAFKNTVTPRFGVEATKANITAPAVFGSFKVMGRAGFSYVPSPVPDQTGLTNYMDSNRWVVAGGAGLELEHIRGFSNGPVRLDIGGQVHVLNRRTVWKDPSLLSDKDGDGILDYPRGYPLSGSVTSGGLSWALSASLAFQFDAVKSRDPYGLGPRKALRQSAQPPEETPHAD